MHSGELEACGICARMTGHSERSIAKRMPSLSAAKGICFLWLMSALACGRNRPAAPNLDLVVAPGGTCSDEIGSPARPASPMTSGQVPVGGTSKNSRELAQQHNHRGIELAQQGNHLAALEEFRDAIRLSPDYAEAFYNLGVSLDQIGDLDQALEAFRSAVRFRPDSAPIRLRLGGALLKKDDLAAATQELRRAVELDPKSADAHYNLALALGQRGDLGAAAAELRDSIRLRPSFAQAHQRLGVTLRRQGKNDEALAEFRLVVRQAPSDPEAHYNLGLALREKGEPGEALAEFQRAVELKLDYEQARYNRAVILRETGKGQAAALDMREMAALSQFRKDLAQAKSLTVSASERLKLHDPEGALGEAQRSLGLWKDNPAAFFMMGLARQEKGEFSKTRENFEKAIELKEDYVEARNSLGLLLWRQGDRNGAVDLSIGRSRWRLITPKRTTTGESLLPRAETWTAPGRNFERPSL